MKEITIICGPTASGKTDFAHAYAKECRGEIVNADAMQIYRQAPIITASPSLHLRNELPYHLYNFYDFDQIFSTAKYCEVAIPVIKEIASRDVMPIIVGGSGLYLSILINGYSLIPDVDDCIRHEVRKLHAEVGAEAFFAKLQALDRKVAAVLHVNDTHRVIRAYEIFKQTGRSILYFQQNCIKPLGGFNFKIILLMPERKFLYQSCNTRFLSLLAAGVLDEINTIFQDYPNLHTAGMRILGVKEIVQHLKGELTISEVISIATAKTRQYAKRQCTWFKHQLPADTEILKFDSAQEYQLATASVLKQI